VLFETVSGKDFDRRVGPMTLAEMAVAAVRIRSFSTRILGRLGTIVDKMPTTSSARSPGSLIAVDACRECSLVLFSEAVDDAVVSVKLVGLVVNMAVRSRRNRS